MASKESLGRVRHFNLISQQLRLRHLRSISVRNIVPKFAISGDCLLDCLLETYFTLHSVRGSQEAIYTSEKIKYSLNPTWASFEPSAWTEQQSTAMGSVILKIWGGQNDKFNLIIEWEVHLPSLQYLGDQVRSSKYGHNTVIFGLIDGYYGAAPTVLSSDESRNNGGMAVSQRTDIIKVDLDQVHASCKLSSVQRLQSMQKAILHAQLSVKDVCQSIQSKVESDMKCTSQLSEEEMLKLKLKLLREECLSKQKLLLKEREEEQSVLVKLREREANLKRNRGQLDSNRASLREHKQAHLEKRESFVKLTTQLNFRRRQLISELMNIYPIVELPTSKEFLICGVRLPNCESDEFQAMDEETLSVALGYTCHLVSMIAQFLDLPLRYPMKSRGSRSTLMDFAIEKVGEKDREFPLYNKGKERIQFYYGTFLLNKNIAQLRQTNGLGTPNLRNTLPNLKDLLETKFRTSDSHKSAPLTIIRKSPLKREKKQLSTSGSGGSSESSPSNPKLDDVLLKTMNASTSDAKSAAPTPVTAVQLDQMQNVENPGNKGDNLNSPSQRSLGDLPEETVAVDQTDRPASAPPVDNAQLHIPSQGTSHKFLEQQRIRKAIKHEDDVNVNAKVPRTLSFKSRKNTNSERHKLLRRNKSVDGSLAGKGARPKVAESSLNDWIKVDVKNDRPSLQTPSSLNQDVASTTNGESPLVNRDSNEKTAPSENPGAPDKPLVGNEGEVRSKTLFDVQGTIDFDFCENGEIDLR